MTTAIAAPADDPRPNPRSNPSNNGKAHQGVPNLNDPVSAEGRVCLAQALFLMNRAIKAYHKHPKIRSTLRDAKSAILSLLLENRAPGVDLTWDLKSNGDELVSVKIRSNTRLHCPLRKLTQRAQRSVLDRIGPAKS